MCIESIRRFIAEKAEQFGAKTESGFNKSYVERNNTGVDALKDNGAYFGFIHPDEEASGPFHDFSLILFPSKGEKSWLVSLCVGSSGFKNDYELATYPGVRRLFGRLVDERGFCKSDFSDIDTGLPKSITGSAELHHLKNTIKKYAKYLPACQVVDDPESENGKRVIGAFVAGYAKLREWPTNGAHRKAVAEALQPFMPVEIENESQVVSELLKERRFVVLEGPPGTGKTRMARKVAEGLNAKIYFTQFHAETSYSDFIFGIRPDTSSEELRYREYLGSFAQALQYAMQKPQQEVVLIIDEINRANLSNVLGPVFYLFEHKTETTDIEIEIAPGLRLTKLPDNLRVIATMNTADRSLAVVDFALRRRFAWYAMKPRMIQSKQFFKADFVKIQEIFHWYASSGELNLMPGQGYFLANSEDEMKNRIRYEILPLIKEYLQEGLLQSAKEEFNTYFLTRIKRSLFE